jgi:hypothetical protein
VKRRERAVTLRHIPDLTTTQRWITTSSRYPPDKQDKATQTVLEQAKLLCGDWAGD